MSALPPIHLKPKHGRRARAGCPWVYSNEIEIDAAARKLAPGSLVRLTGPGGDYVATGFFNPRSLIAVRTLTRDENEAISAEFFRARIASALRLRERLFQAPFYRLVHAEGDGLPGLVVDRHGPVLVAQMGAAGMERCEDDIVAALRAELDPQAIVLRNDAPSRALEGLPLETRLVHGSLPGRTVIEENGCNFAIDPVAGQKTGWFYDQRLNRAFLAGLSRERRVLDVYCHSGGFGIAALAHGATHALFLDSSQSALDLARESAALTGVGDKASFAKGDVFETLEVLRNTERFGAVVCDPPAFVKSKKDLEAGARGYRKLARLAAPLVEPEGVFFIASCSHNISPERFAEEAIAGLTAAGRTGRIIAQTFAAPDHPVHPLLPETAYLKALTLVLD